MYITSEPGQYNLDSNIDSPRDLLAASKPPSPQKTRTVDAPTTLRPTYLRLMNSCLREAVLLYSYLLSWWWPVRGVFHRLSTPGSLGVTNKSLGEVTPTHRAFDRPNQRPGE